MKKLFDILKWTAILLILGAFMLICKSIYIVFTNDPIDEVSKSMDNIEGSIFLIIILVLIAIVCHKLSKKFTKETTAPAVGTIISVEEAGTTRRGSRVSDIEVQIKLDDSSTVVGKIPVFYSKSEVNPYKPGMRVPVLYLIELPKLMKMDYKAIRENDKYQLNKR